MDRIFEELQRLLNARLAQTGETEAKLAKIAGCSQVHINRLKNKDGSFETLKLSTFLALFPELARSLAAEVHRRAEAAGVGVPPASATATGAIDAAQASGAVMTYRMRLMDAIIELDIEVTAKDAVLRAVRAVPIE